MNVTCSDPDTAHAFLERAKRSRRATQGEDDDDNNVFGDHPPPPSRVAEIVSTAVDLMFSSDATSITESNINSNDHDHDEIIRRNANENENDSASLRRIQDAEFEESLRQDESKEREQRLEKERATCRENELRSVLGKKREALQVFASGCSGMDVSPAKDKKEKNVRVMFREPDGHKFEMTFETRASLQVVFDTLDVQRGKYCPGSYELVFYGPPMKKYNENKQDLNQISVVPFDRSSLFIVLSSTAD